MNPTVVEVLKLLGYPLSSIIVLVVLAYVFRESFHRLLASVAARDLESVRSQNAQKLEEIKNEYQLVLQDKKAELTRETEHLRAKLSIEAETYRLAAQKRFESLMALWDSSEALFRATDFSSRESITRSLESFNQAIEDLEKCSVLFTENLESRIRDYLNEVGTVLTTTEADFEHKKVTTKDIAHLIRWGSSAIRTVSEEAGIIGAIGADIIVSVSEHLEERRWQLAKNARQHLAEALRIELGVIVSDEKPLATSVTVPPNVS